MFDFLTNKKNEDDSDALIKATFNQKCSIINFLFLIHLYHNSIPSSKGEHFIDNCINMLGVSKIKCLENVELYGSQGVISDLHKLNDGQKSNFTLLAIELMVTDSALNKNKIDFIQHFFEDLGLTEEKFLQTLFFMKLKQVTLLTGNYVKK